MRHRLFPRAAAVALLFVAGCRDHRHAVRVTHAWVRLAAVPGRPAVAYLTVQSGATPNRLVAVASTQARLSELHRSMTSGAAMASMRRLDGVDLAAGETVSFAPGGYHVMLFGVSPLVKAGGAVPLTVRFAAGTPVPVTAKVVAAGDPAPY